MNKTGKHTFPISILNIKLNETHLNRILTSSFKNKNFTYLRIYYYYEENEMHDIR